MSSRKSILRTSHAIPRPVSARSTKSFEISANKPQNRKKLETKPAEKEVLDLSEDFSSSRIEEIPGEPKQEPVMYFSTPIKPIPVLTDTYDVLLSPEFETPAKSLFNSSESCELSDIPGAKKATSEKEESENVTVVNRNEPVGVVSCIESRPEMRLNGNFLLFMALLSFNALVLLYFYDRIVSLQHDMIELRGAVLSKYFVEVCQQQQTDMTVYYGDSIWEKLICAIFKIYGAMVDVLNRFT